ncbi:MAG: hypothetical protein ACTHJT_13630 [Cytophaga sp.]|uniref:hypothetical protein n=1 Tax=Cytophaga sp. TaxID=29535 RepID=UPI003F7E36FB
MSKIKPEFKLRSIQADSLFDAVMKTTTLVLTLCAEDPFTFKVRQLRRDAHTLQFYLSFDQRKVKILLYDPKVHASAETAIRKITVGSGKWVRILK